jgi:hypothetical protein
MAKHKQVIKGKAAWVIAEPVTKALPNNLGFEEDGFIARFGLEGQIGQFVRHDKRVLKFETEPDATAAGFAELECQIVEL